MFERIAENSATLRLATSLVMTGVWIAYLQIFLTIYLRQRRPDIIISLGAGVGMKTRCFVANLGLEPVYLSDVIVDLVSGRGHQRATITDRTELGEDRLRDPAEATNQGPLESGKYVDIGSFETLVQRVRQQGVDLDDGGEVDSVEMIAVAEAASSGTHVGAARAWRVVRDGDQLHLRTETLETRQLRSFRQRRRMRHELSDRLADAS